MKSTYQKIIYKLAAKSKLGIIFLSAIMASHTVYAGIGTYGRYCVYKSTTPISAQTYRITHYGLSCMFSPPSPDGVGWYVPHEVDLEVKNEGLTCTGDFVIEDRNSLGCFDAYKRSVVSFMIPNPGDGSDSGSTTLKWTNYAGISGRVEIEYPDTTDGNRITVCLGQGLCGATSQYTSQDNTLYFIYKSN